MIKSDCRNTSQVERDWRVAPYVGSNPINIVDAEGRLIAVVSRSTYFQSQDNANLAAAAPDMHKLLAYPSGKSHQTSDPGMVWIRLPEEEYKRVMAKVEGKEVKK